MMKAYLDNAATTPIRTEVIQVMSESMESVFGNPSSTHQFGRKAKALVETARKNIASHFNITASEIIFTAGGTEADNLILQNAITNLGVKRIITSKIEHHAVLHTVDFLKDEFKINVEFVGVLSDGSIDLKDLKERLDSSEEKTLVSLMYVNNEIGNMLPLKEVISLCDASNALFHSDTVQAIGHYALDLQETPIDFIAASAHKFNGPKGVGFAYFKKGFGIKPMLHGGDQEKGARSSTENVHAIVGMEKALSLSYESSKEDEIYMNTLKRYFISAFRELVPGVSFNGLSSDLTKSSCTILNVLFPFSNDMLLFSLDLQGIAVSGGSACQSGSSNGSHVLAEIQYEEQEMHTSIRFSFSKHTTKEELDYTIEKLKELL
ncbi:cysteine desulfurase family protein [Flavobacteriaceae bacterium S356]|uniref:cysteine desulfurase n=1 Tax=Asprobacillus argus TaxID=3076534 RepID=A0ABU3LCX3_9FLAO|nr:cysteine desulfurase family protein [Flavobacteriaceae bacterium S356]